MGDPRHHSDYCLCAGASCPGHLLLVQGDSWSQHIDKGVCAFTLHLYGHLCLLRNLHSFLKRADADVAGFAAAGMVLLCLAAKLFMSFRVRLNNLEGPYAETVSKAQLNAAEYDELFVAIFLAFSVMRIEGIFVTIVCCTVVLAQAVYFWGRAATGEAVPWAPLGALPLYLCILSCVVILGMNLFS